jgi:hypothetical protein
MTTTEVRNARRDAAVGKVDMKLEIQVVPVSASGQERNSVVGSA